MSDQPENASLPNARDSASVEAFPRSLQHEAQRDPPSHARATPLVDSMDGTLYSEQALLSALEAHHRADDHDDDRTLHQPDTPPRATAMDSGSVTRAPVDSSTAKVYDLKLHQKPSRTGQGVVDHSTTPPRRARGIIFRTPECSPRKPKTTQNNEKKTDYNGAMTNGFVVNTSTSKDKANNRPVASVSDGQAHKSKVKSDNSAKTNGFASDNNDNGVVARVAIGHAPTESKDKADDGAKTNGFARHARLFSSKGDDGAVASVSSGHTRKSMDNDVNDAEPIDGFAGTASTFSDKDEDGAVTSVSAGHALSDKDHDVAETSGIARPISMPYDKDDDGAVTSGSSGHIHGFNGKHDDGAEPSSFAGHASSLNDHDGAETSGFAGHASTMNNEDDGDAETGGVVKHARSLLAVLSAVCTFGASPTFSSLHGDLKHTAHPSFIAWSFASFAIGIVVTLVWQAALISDFRGFTGRLYRSELGIVVALAIGFAAITSGTVFLSLSLAVDTDPGVRAAGFTVIGVVGFLFCCSLIRLAFTVVRRTRKHAGAQETAPPV